MNKFYLVALFLLTLSRNEVNAQSKKGKWIQHDVTIDYNESLNPFLTTYASVSSFICNEKGEYKLLGRFLMIKNNSADTIFYRASPKGLGNYVSQNSVEFIQTVSNMLLYYPVPPNQTEVVVIDGYETQRVKEMMMKLIIDFKFFLHDSISKKTIDKLTNNKPSTQARQTNPAPTTSLVNSFYIFLTTDFNLTPKQHYLSNLESPKTLSVISKPILHTGNLSDLLVAEKDQFIFDIDKQVLNKPEGLQTTLRNNNYENILVHFGKLYSTTLLKTEKDGFEAIEAYENSTKELFEGLGNVEFLRLK